VLRSGKAAAAFPTLEKALAGRRGVMPIWLCPLAYRHSLGNDRSQQKAPSYAHEKESSQ
jgi:hypothetical protein